MRLFTLVLISILCLSVNIEAQSIRTDTTNKHLSKWAYEVINLPVLECNTQNEIIVAVIDDGFRLSHNGLREYIYVNKKEIPNNQIDDDNNGYIDDYSGWDVADGDNDVNVKKELQEDYFHGTFVSSVITTVASECFGKNAPKHIKILPVKVLSDYVASTAIINGYEGITYANTMNADIICCAWSGGKPDKDDLEVIYSALNSGVIIIGSAGNTYKEGADSPASITGVKAIAALDTSLRKYIKSNYGMEIDLALPGQNVRAAYPVANNAWFYGEGTSASAALATGCMAVLKAINPDANPKLFMEALINTSVPIDNINLSYCGKLGAGLPNLTSAVEYLTNADKRADYFNSYRTKGTIVFSGNNPVGNWIINPYGSYHSIKIIPDFPDAKTSSNVIKIGSKDSTVYYDIIEDIEPIVTVPGNYASIELIPNKKKRMPKNLKFNYYVETIDSASLYCSGTKYIKSASGIIHDNSMENEYANNCDCKWLISAPANTQINIAFTEFDTEAKTDFVWLFDGASANIDNIIAKFSGPELPPNVTSRTNTVLVWFVTNDIITGEGWKLKFDTK